MLRTECNFIYISFTSSATSLSCDLLFGQISCEHQRVQSINPKRETIFAEIFYSTFWGCALCLMWAVGIFFWMKFYNFYFSMASIHFSSTLDAADENLDSIFIWSNWSETWYWLKLTSLLVITERKFEWVFMTSHKQLLCVVAQRIMTIIVHWEEDAKTSTKKQE